MSWIEATFYVYRIDFDDVSKRLCIQSTCIETTLYRNDRTPSVLAATAEHLVKGPTDISRTGIATSYRQHPFFVIVVLLSFICGCWFTTTSWHTVRGTTKPNHTCKPEVLKLTHAHAWCRGVWWLWLSSVAQHRVIAWHPGVRYIRAEPLLEVSKITEKKLQPLSLHMRMVRFSLMVF